MTTELRIEIVSSDLARIVESVFDTMIDLGVSESRAPWFSGADRLMAIVHLAGSWNGAVLLECNWGQACRFASQFLSMDPAGAEDDVVRDVLGELANMIGGNLKSELLPGIRLSSPSVVDGSDYSLRVRGAEIRQRITFQCDEGLFWVAVLTS